MRGCKEPSGGRGEKSTTHAPEEGGAGGPVGAGVSGSERGRRDGRGGGVVELKSARKGEGNTPLRRKRNSERGV